MAAFATERTNGILHAPATSESSENRLPGMRKGRATETPSVFGAAAKSIEFSDRMRNHYREARRIPADIACSVEVVLLDGTVYDSGVAVLRNISPSGALIGSFDMDGGNFPMELFKIRLVLKGDPYAGIGIEATPVRFAHATHGIGIKFDEIFVAV